jgi:hypothetical protein
MARLTAQDMVEMVRDYCGGETSETLSDTRLLRFLNQAYMEVCSRYRFDQLSTSETLTMVSGTANYEMAATNVLYIDNVIDDTSNIPVRAISKNQYQEWTSGNISGVTGTPVYWFLNGVGSNSRYQLTFYPTPNNTNSVIVYYTQEPTELVLSPTATSMYIPEPWDDVVIHKATQRAWRMLGDMQMSMQWAGATKEIEDAAKRTTYQVSSEPVQLGSIVGQACR